VLICYFSFTCAVITHNTIHCPVFYSRWANKIFQVVLTITYGHPVSSYVPGHNMSHHHYVQGPKDVMRTTKARFRWNLLNQLFFAAAVGKAVTKNDILFTRHIRKERPQWFAQLRLEMAVFILVSLALLALNWKAFLLYFL